MILAEARRAKDKMDLAALGRARRRIQERVEAGRAQVKAGTRAGAARWETSGRPTRDADRGSAPPHPAPIPPSASPPHAPLAIPPPIDLDADPNEGWEIAELPDDATRRQPDHDTGGT